MTKLLAENGAPEDVAQPTFDSIPLSREVRRAVDDLGYSHPTPVQQAVFDSVAAGKDIVVQARTGTGKTAAFGLPIIDRLVNPQEKEAQILILSPTRELALQINRELENLAKYKDIECTAVYGGAAMQPQIDAIRRGTQVIAGTPGRVLDHLERGVLNPKTIRALVLDESDEMLSMGFLPQITRIMERLPKKRQTLLFSATLPADVKRIAETRLTDPEFITLSGDHIGALSIDHCIYRSAGNKALELVQILEIENPESAIIFCNTKDQTKRLSATLNKHGFAADWLNADLAQNDREKVMKATRESRLRFLVCTDVAARGIDISHLTHVINADFPESTEAYVHRTGRTGRAGKTGTAISLVTPQDVGNLYMLRLTYKIYPVERSLPSAGDLQTRQESDLVEFLYRGFAGRGAAPTMRSLARRVLTSDMAESIVAGLLLEHLGGHPQATEQAAAVRRDASPASPPPAAPPAAKAKKVAPPPMPRAPSPATPPTQKREEPRVQPVIAEKRVPNQLKNPAPAAMKASVPRPALPNTPKTSETGDFEKPLEVVSASDLLSAADRALLSGDDAPAALPKAQKVPAPADDPNVARIFVDAGKLDKLQEDDFLDTMEDNGYDAQHVVFVNVRDTHCFIGVELATVDQAVAALHGRLVAGLEVSAEKARPRRGPSGPRA